MKSIRISDNDHSELVKRRDQTGVSIIYQVSEMIKKSKEAENEQRLDNPTPKN